MKLEAGMYVRFYNGDFGKVANYEYREEYVNGHTIYLENNDIGLCCEEKDFKASHNIIDLIEVGDYVNGREVIDIKMKCDETIKYLITKGYDITNEMIKSIVTKEQFQKMEYRIGE